MASLECQEITALLPHRYPMLMVDRIVEITNDSVVGIKNVTVNEPHFIGHFPGYPVMPGVLVGYVAPHTRGQVMFLATIEEAKFRRPVVPGDQLRIEMKLLRLKYTVAKMQGIATVDGQTVAEATLMCKLILPAPEPAPEDKTVEAPTP